MKTLSVLMSLAALPALADWQPNPPPVHPVKTEIVSCSSGSYQFQRCMVPGAVVRMRLLAQHSSSACVYGRTYGAQLNSIWVTQGCRADFAVTYRVQ